LERKLDRPTSKLQGLGGGGAGGVNSRGGGGGAGANNHCRSHSVNWLERQRPAVLSYTQSETSTVGGPEPNNGTAHGSSLHAVTNEPTQAAAATTPPASASWHANFFPPSRRLVRPANATHCSGGGGSGGGRGGGAGGGSGGGRG